MRHLAKEFSPTVNKHEAQAKIAPLLWLLCCWNPFALTLLAVETRLWKHARWTAGATCVMLAGCTFLGPNVLPPAHVQRYRAVAARCRCPGPVLFRCFACLKMPADSAGWGLQ
jgi:hypothetical protein